MNFSKYLFRCSSLGHLMTEPKGKKNLEKYNDAFDLLGKLKVELLTLPEFNKDGKTPNKNRINKLAKIEEQEKIVLELEKIKDEVQLSDSALTHLIDCYVSAKYGRNTDISNKYLVKGNQVEEDSITLFSRVNKQFFKKNEDRIANDFIIGTPDLYLGNSILNAEHIIDIKSSWDIFTFFRNKNKDVKSLYYWQLQGYMALTGAKSSTLAYCLTNTPNPLIFEEKKRLLWKMGVNEDDENYIKACDEIDRLSIYDDIPIEERVMTFDIERNDDDIEMIYKKVNAAREYLNSI